MQTLTLQAGNCILKISVALVTFSWTSFLQILSCALLDLAFGLAWFSLISSFGFFFLQFLLFTSWFLTADLFQSSELSFGRVVDFGFRSKFVLPSGDVKSKLSFQALASKLSLFDSSLTRSSFIFPKLRSFLATFSKFWWKKNQRLLKNWTFVDINKNQLDLWLVRVFLKVHLHVRV